MQIKISDLSNQLNEVLEEYKTDVTAAVNDVGHAVIKQLTNETRRNAPKNTGEYKKHISWKSAIKNAMGDKEYTWYVRGTNANLTHLLTNGHQLRNGGRTRANPFLKDAVENARIAYEKRLMEELDKLSQK